MKRRKKIKSKNRRRAMKFGPSPTSPITLASFLGPLAVLMTKGLAGDREEISMDPTAARASARVSTPRASRAGSARGSTRQETT